MISIKRQKYTKARFIILLASSILCGLLNFPSTSHAKQGRWTQKADMPTPLMQLATAVVNGKIYAIGGLNGGSRPTVAEYDPQRNVWTNKADMPTPRGGIAASAVDGKIYVFGGHRVAFQPLDTVQMYDPAKDKWTRKKRMPVPMDRMTTSVVNGQIYLIGGWDFPDDVYATVFQYNPAGDIWTRKADMPTARGGHAAVVFEEKIYVLGGGTFKETTHGGIRYFDVVEMYDPVEDRWTRKTKMPVPNIGLGVETVNEKIYTIGGTASDNTTRLSRIDIFTPEDNVWLAEGGTRLPIARGGLSVSKVNDKIYAFGGFSGLGVVPTVNEYDPSVLSVSPKDNIVTTWGAIKRNR